MAISRDAKRLNGDLPADGEEACGIIAKRLEVWVANC
jgi:hypothetical protein